MSRLAHFYYPSSNQITRNISVLPSLVAWDKDDLPISGFPRINGDSNVQILVQGQKYITSTALFEMPSYGASNWTIQVEIALGQSNNMDGRSLGFTFFRPNLQTGVEYYNYNTEASPAMRFGLDFDTIGADPYPFNTGAMSMWSGSNLLTGWSGTSNFGAGWPATSYHTHTATYSNGVFKYFYDFNLKGTFNFNPTQLSTYSYAFTSNTWAGLHFAIAGQNTPNIFIRNFRMLCSPPPWTASDIYHEYDKVVLNSLSYVLVGKPSSVGESPTTPVTILGNTGGWVRSIDTVTVADTSTLSSNELFLHPTLSTICTSNAAFPTYSTYNSSNVYSYGDQVIHNGLVNVWFGTSSTSNVAPVNIMTNGFSSPTTLNTWVSRYAALRNLGGTIYSASNVHILYRGSIYRSKLTSQTYATNSYDTEFTFQPWNTTYWHAPTWAQLTYAPGTYFKYGAESNIVYRQGTIAATSNITPNSNVTFDLNGWSRVYNSATTIICDNPTNTQTYRQSNIVYGTDRNAYFYAYTNANLATSLDTKNSNWVLLTTSAAEAGDYLYDSTSNVLMNYVDSDHGVQSLIAWRSATPYPALTTVGHYGQGYATFYAKNSNVALTNQNSNWSNWVPFWRSDNVKTYYQNNLTYYGDRFYTAFNKVTNEITPLIDNSTLSQWLPIYQDGIPFYSNSYIYANSNQAVYKVLRSADAEFMNPISDSNESVYMLSSIPRTGPINLGSLAGIYFGVGRLDERYPWTPNALSVLRWYNTASGLSLSSNNVVSWADSSSNNVTALSDNVNYPTLSNTRFVPHYNTEPYAMFAGGSGQKLTIGSLGTTPTFTVVMATFINSLSGTRVLFKANNVGLQSAPASRQFQIFSGTQFYGTDTNDYNVGQPMIVSMTGSWASSNHTLTTYVNSLLVDNQVFPTRPHFNLSGLTLGNDPTLARGLNGGIAQFALYNTVLSTTDRQLVEGYMAWDCFKSGATLNASNPYRQIAPILTNV